MNAHNATSSIEIFSVLLERYAKLLVEHGLNVQPGQLVCITAEQCHRELVQQIGKEAYKRRASYVHVELFDPHLQRIRLQESVPEYRSASPQFLSAKFGELVDSEAANLRLVGSEWPEYLADLDKSAVNQVRQANYLAAKRFYSEGIEQSKVHWCVAAAATPAWGRKLFPNLTSDQAYNRLWQELFTICRLNSEDFILLWQLHNTKLTKRAAVLSSLGISELHFVGPGTDLRVGITERAFFKGGSERSSRGMFFEPNIPTEECFTTPDCRLTSGTVKATRPFLVNGELVQDLTMVFSDGVMTHFDCRTGRDSFNAYISNDPGAKRLGEVALVGADSPIFQSGLVFEEILLDENAACHIAIGSAYRGCLRDGAALRDEECVLLGCNVSSVHTDIMISSRDVNVFATLRSGEKIPLIDRGDWCDDRLK